MKKISQVIAVGMLFFIVGIYACSKKDPTPAPTPPANNSTLSFDATTDKVTVSCALTSGIYTLTGVSSSDTASCQLTFDSIPSNGTYFTDVTLTAYDCTLSFTKNTTTYTAPAGGSVVVSIVNGKVAASFTNLRTQNGIKVKNISASLNCN